MNKFLSVLAGAFLLAGALATVVITQSTPAYGGLYSDATVVRVALEAGHGTGVYIGNNQVITAAHVAVHGVTDGFTVTDANGNEVHATVLWFNEVSDVGLLRLDAPLKGVVPAPLLCTNRDLRVGDSVKAIGYPLSLGVVSTWGHVGGKVSTRQSLHGDQVNAIADLTIANGNSGGPLFDISGNLAGIVVAVALAPLMSQIGPIPGLVPLTYVIPKSVLCHELTAEHDAPKQGTE